MLARRRTGVVVTIIGFNRPEVRNCIGPTTHAELVGAWTHSRDDDAAEEHAPFGITCRRWNIGLADGGTQRLPRIIGMGRALELIITGRVIGACEAERIGLVSELVPKGTSLARALDLAEFICSLPQPAIRTDKEAVVRGFGLPLAQGLEIEAECFNRSIHDPATAEGLRQLLERDHQDRRGDGRTRTPGLVRDDPRDR